MFEHTLKLVGATSDETWHVGASLNSDIASARNAGLAGAVWLNRHGHTRTESDPAPHHEVESLRAFTALLDRHVS